MPRMVDRDDDDDEKCPHLGVSPPQLRHAPSVTIRHQQHSHSATQPRISSYSVFVRTQSIIGTLHPAHDDMSHVITASVSCDATDS